MIRTNNIGGFFIFLLTILFLWFGILVIDLGCILYWFYEPNIDDRLISVLPTTKIGTVLFVMFNSLGYLATVAHLKASLGDPGIITKEIAPPSVMPVEEMKKCKKCNDIWKPMRAHHCSECRVCIFKMDHHGPWINNGVGIKNSKSFFLFTFYTGLGALLSIVILVTSIVLLVQEESDHHVNKPYYAISFFLCICVMVESILFSFFTLELVGEQIESFQDNQTYVDDLKDLIGVPMTLGQALFVWLGEDWWFWMLPTKPILNINYCERLFKIQEIVSKQYKDISQYDYDPQGKMKALARSESKLDKIYFCVYTVSTIVGAYFLFSYLSM